MTRKISIIGVFILLWCIQLVYPQAALAGTDWKLAKNLYIVFDASGSMWQQKCAGDDYKINVAKNALTTFLSIVPADYNLGLFVFDDKGSREIYPLGKVDRSRFIKQVKSIFAGGKTPLCNALDQARKALAKQKKKQLGYGEYTLLVVTDGEANDKKNLPRHVLKITNQGIVIQVIGFCLDSEHSLMNMVHKYRDAKSPAELASAMEAVLGEAEEYTDMSEFDTFSD